MQTANRLTLTIILCLLLGAISLYAQDKGKGKQKGKGKPGKEKIHAPPPWAPAHGFHKRHIYFPDHLCYYDRNKGLYIYFSEKNNNWTTVSDVPLVLKKVDLKAAVKVEIDLDDDIDFPQQFFEEHRKLFPKGHIIK
ncbi:MAG: hypothetical protein HYY40_14640 [Bacteroidetes bacterium]|nr:hypothetical protein [Bacteroidota bacterium]